ncbi:MAG: ABC transporter permease [Gammaproteobacteria bacterium]
MMRARADWLSFYVLIFIVLLYLPSVFVLIFSLNSGIHVAFPLKSLTIDWYSRMISNDALLAAALNSLRIGAISAMAATIIGVLGAFVLVRYRPPGSKPIATLAMLPLLIPGVILGISMLVMLRVMGFQNSLIAVACGHVMFCTPLTLSIMSSRFVALDAAIEEAALDLGANEWRTFMSITLPLCWSAMLSSFILAFVASFDEFIIAFFLAGTQITLPLYIWGQLRFPNRLPEILALGSCTLAFSFACVLLAEWLRRRSPLLT